MFKVFIVEDDSVVRETLRKSIPWEQCGFINVGDASDGEMALPMICAQRPDVVIANIQMPFMDGLELSRRLKQQFPQTKIIVTSSYGDFHSVQQAIQLGVEQYLLKPVTKGNLVKALMQVREKLVQEQEQRSYLEQLERENQQKQEFERRSFFEKLISGEKSVNWIYEEAERLHIPIAAQSYNLVLLTLYSESGMDREQHKALQELQTFFLRFAHFSFFQCSLNLYGILICEDDVRIASETRFCVESVKRHLERLNNGQEWYIAAGTPTKRLSGLHACFAETNKILSYRHLCIGQHELTKDSINSVMVPHTEADLHGLDISNLAPQILLGFLKTGTSDEVEEFVSRYLQGMGADAFKSMLFCQYIMLHVRFTCTGVLNQIGIGSQELLSAVEHLPSVEKLFGLDNVKRYCVLLLERTLLLREQAQGQRYHEAVRLAMRYMEQNYSDSTLSLNDVATYVKISPNYFSTLFSQETGKTFIEYLTARRMEQARKLLQETNLRSSEVATSVGYKDPHYFSYLFRKTQGQTPREFRSKVNILA